MAENIKKSEDMKRNDDKLKAAELDDDALEQISGGWERKADNGPKCMVCGTTTGVGIFQTKGGNWVTLCLKDYKNCFNN